jgi:Spy/CpxP family protein refolding chaperone
MKNDRISPNYLIWLVMVAAAMVMVSGVATAEPSSRGGHGMSMSSHGKYGQHGRGHKMYPHNAAIHFIKLGKYLELDSDQYMRLKELRDQYIQDNSVAEKQLKVARMDLKWLLYSDDMDRAAVDKKLAEIGRLEKQLWTAFVDQLEAIKSMLTAEQQENLREMKRHGKRAHGMGMGRRMMDDMEDDD